MNDRDRDLPPELERQWREWASTEPSIDERQLRRNLLARIPDRRPRTRSRLVLVAAAASLLALVIGIETTRRPQPPITAEGAVVYETGANVILVLREGSEPIYVATEPSADRIGEKK
jgi:ferric-dicitrate binding protein FerR (iron transport regulator)